jgi:transposase
MRLSIDTKATIDIGPFSRGGYTRINTQAADHDFGSDSALKLFGIAIPALDENYMYFTENNATADFMIDALEHLWPSIQRRLNPHTIVINSDNGPENNSRRSQFMKRLVEFAITKSVNISLAYYPPYHSKYNPIERVWGILEKHWNGEILDSVEKVLGLCRTMTWNGKPPVVKLMKGIYKKGVTLTKNAMEQVELFLDRIPGIEKWAVDIPCYVDW